MSYTTTVKEEICTQKNSKSEAIAELSAYIRNNSTITKDKVIMTTENQFIVGRIQERIKDLYQVSLLVETIDNVNFSKKELYQMTLKEQKDSILQDLGILDENQKYLETVPNYIVGANEEIRAYLRGVFLGTGSVNDPKKSRYHLELLINEPQESVFVQKLLNLFDLNAKILNRDKGYMIYMKEAEKISDFLKILGTNKSVLYYEDVRVYRDQKNKTNRLNNMEQANIDKVIQNASEQLEDIEVIEENDGLMLLGEKAKLVVEYRKKYPESSLKELAEIISIETNKPITKSGLNHRFHKIKDLANKFRKMKQKKESE